MEKIFTKQELASLLKLSPRSIDRKVAASELPPAFRIGGLPRWRESVIAKWVQDGCPKLNGDD